MKRSILALGTIAVLVCFISSLAVTAPCPPKPKCPPKRNTDLPADPWGTIPVVPNNSACLECHKTFKAEEMVTQHNKANIACVRCHGKSEAHVADKKGLVAPDKMFTGKTTIKMCGKCHDDHDVPAVKVVAQWLKKNPKRKSIEGATCINCHGDHKIEKRTTIWDKETGKLISKLKVEEKEE